MLRRLVPIAAVALLAACTTNVTKTTPPATSETPTDPAEGSAQVQPFDETEVQALFDEKCTKCHDAENPLLDLSAPFAKKTNGAKTGTQACSKSKYRAVIAPGDREASLLWHKVKGTADCGRVMPFDSGNPKLDATQLERLGLYIDGLAQ